MFGYLSSTNSRSLRRRSECLGRGWMQDRCRVELLGAGGALAALSRVASILAVILVPLVLVLITFHVSYLAVCSLVVRSGAVVASCCRLAAVVAATCIRAGVAVSPTVLRSDCSFMDKHTARLTSVSAASVPAAVLVAAAGHFAVVVPLEAPAPGGAAAPEPARPVVKAFVRGGPALRPSSLYCFSRVSASSRCSSANVTSSRKSQASGTVKLACGGVTEVTTGGERQSIRHRDGWRGEEKREREEGEGVVVKTRAATPPEDKTENN
ncbi:hypothetical protein F7725_020363 [Dissostichus mawsoni]|uniref:Uncharacterized protein n=1 Tax=Dissostichus mawsoni TaxID=36200 RepID=A0A7J5YCZ8_DISMA|nr:hypothetical protein F7725_020363 [Dissostichus mawsoni]